MNKILSLVVSKPRLAIEVLLVSVVLIGGWLYNRKLDQIRQIEAVHAGLEAELQQQIKIAQNEVEIVRKDLTGKIIYKKVYVPPEGYVVIKQKDQEALMKKYNELIGQLAGASEEQKKAIEEALKKLREEMGMSGDVIVKWWGFTSRIGGGMELANRGIQPRLDVKWFFISRWGTEVGVSPNGVGLTVSRHIDDIMWGKPQNVEPFVGYQVFRFNNSSQLIGGLRFNF